MKKKIMFLLVLLVSILLPLFLLSKVYPKKIYEINNNDYQINPALRWNISEHSLDDTNYMCSGWVLLPGVEQGYPVLDNKTIWLFDTDKEIFYKLIANQSSMRDPEITQIIDDGLDYQSSSFNVSLNLKKLDIVNKHFDIYICYQWQNINHIVNTKMSIIKGKLIQK